jgi:hypothetical protein
LEDKPADKIDAAAYLAGHPVIRSPSYPRKFARIGGFFLHRVGLEPSRTEIFAKSENRVFRFRVGPLLYTAETSPAPNRNPRWALID